MARLEPKISEILLTGAKAADVQKLQVDVMDLKDRFAGVDGRLSGIEGGLAGIDGRLSGIEWRFSQIPTTWQIIAIFATFLIGISGLLYTSAKFFRP